MENLPDKITRIEYGAYLTLRLAHAYKKAAERWGWPIVEDFYLAKGLNHIERIDEIRRIAKAHDEEEEKQFAWEGLSLSRMPRQHEMIAVKGVSTAQENAKEQISTILLKLRTELISDGLKGIKNLAPNDYHTLTLRASPEIRSRLRDRLITVHKQGRMLVANELGKKQGISEDDFDELDTLTDLTDSRVANDVQSRIVGAAVRFALLGLTGAQLLDAIKSEINAGSVSYIDRASTGLANKVVNIGREDEAQRRKDEWTRVEYSAILDQNVCGPCAAEDGTEADNEADLTPVPNPDCLGGDWCRCFHVFIAD